MGAEPHPAVGARAQLRLPRRSARAVYPGALGALPAGACTQPKAFTERTVVDTGAEARRTASPR